MEMGRLKCRAGEKDQGAGALVLDLAKAFERVSLPVVWAWARHFSFPRKILRMLCGYFEHQRRVKFEGCVAEPLRTITPSCQGQSGVACFHVVLQDALGEVTKNYPPLKLRVFVDDITALLRGKNKEVAEMAKNVIKKLKDEVEKKGSNCQSLRRERKERARWFVRARFLKEELRQCSKEGVTLADSDETLGMDSRLE